MGPSRDGFAMGGLGSPLGCVYARLTGAVWVYPGRAPSASAMCRQAWRSGVAVGRCRTTRRTEPTTCAPNLRSRSRSHVTWARAQAVRAARSRSSCIST